MAQKFLLLALSLSLLVSAAVAAAEQQRPPLQLSEEQQCRFQRLNAVQPTQRIESEGGFTELWDEREDQFQCAGVVAMRNTIRPNGLSLPNYHPTPRMVFILKGQGFIGVNLAGCAETYHAHATQRTRESTEEWERKQQGSVRDLHQKVHRIRQGDIVAIPAGAAHWCYNDGNEELVAVSMNDLNHISNQLDQQPRVFYMAGGVPRGVESRRTFQNIFQAFDRNLMAEAFNVSPEIVERMQARDEQQRGLIVLAKERMSFIRPDEEEEQSSSSDNGLEETFCSMNIRTSIENRREAAADVYSRQAGKINVVDRNKLPILQHMDLSAERGNLYPNAMLSPNWEMNGHTIVYVTRGDAQMEVVSHTGQALMNDRVNEGDMFVVPQYYTSTARAGKNGFEWVAFRTTGSPMRNPVAGYTSVIRAMPLQVLTNAYQISPNQAQELKMNRGGQSVLLSPGGRQN